mmetsp:Transcript_48043/g.135742  ORF Transcript_48043/g.135742 Transcript_48043/m.135742 type:complete len:217 (-) Transcript_48043:142-792(-)
MVCAGSSLHSSAAVASWAKRTRSAMPAFAKAHAVMEMSMKRPELQMVLAATLDSPAQSALALVEISSLASVHDNFAASVGPKSSMRFNDALRTAIMSSSSRQPRNLARAYASIDSPRGSSRTTHRRTRSCKSYHALCWLKDSTPWSPATLGIWANVITMFPASKYRSCFSASPNKPWEVVCSRNSMSISMQRGCLTPMDVNIGGGPFFPTCQLVAE